MTKVAAGTVRRTGLQFDRLAHDGDVLISLLIGPPVVADGAVGGARTLDARWR